MSLSRSLAMTTGRALTPRQAFNAINKPTLDRLAKEARLKARYEARIRKASDALTQGMRAIWSGEFDEDETSSESTSE
jgi:hypothetical protein